MSRASKPAHLRDRYDLARLQAAADKRARKNAKRLHNATPNETVRYEIRLGTNPGPLP